MTQRTGITLFEDKKIRVAWDDEEEKYYFSIVDIVQVLTDSTDGRKYWNKLKQRLKEEGNETVTNCHQLKMPATDGKQRMTDVADLEQLLRIIQSIPSKKAEPVKRWLAEVRAQRVDQMIDPELTFQMAVGAGKCAAHICGVMKRSGKCAPHICEVDFRPESAPRIDARSIFGPKVRPASMRGQFSARKCTPHRCAVKLHK